MEDLAFSIFALILAGWALMLFVPSVVIGVVLSAGFGGAVATLIYVERGRTGDLVADMMVIAPVAAVAVFVAWPVGALFRWALRRQAMR